MSASDTPAPQSTPARILSDIQGAVNAQIQSPLRFRLRVWGRWLTAGAGGDTDDVRSAALFEAQDALEYLKAPGVTFEMVEHSYGK